MYKISWDKEVPNKVATLLKEGLSYKEIGNRLGVSKQTISKLIKMYNLDSHRTTGYKGTLNIDNKEVFRLKESGWTYKQIAEYMVSSGRVKECSVQVIYNRYKKEKDSRKEVIN